MIAERRTGPEGLAVKPRSTRGWRSRVPRWTAGVATALLALLALMGWSAASPVGSSPDDDFHLASIWCAAGDRTGLCESTGDASTRAVPPTFAQRPCYAGDAFHSASCQIDDLSSKVLVESSRGNFDGQYPPVFYAAMSVFAGSDVQTSVLVMRAVNSALFVGLLSALLLLLPPALRIPTAGGFLITAVPLSVFLIASVNPSSWAIIGVGITWMSVLGWFRSTGRRRWGLGALAIVGSVMASGARADAAVYVGIGVAVVIVLEARRNRDFWVSSWLPAVILVIAIGFVLGSSQIASAVVGFGGSGASGAPVDSPLVPGASDVPPPEARTGLGLVLSNLINVPSLWGGALGFWALGWLDTPMPTVIAFASVGAFVAVGFSGLARIDRRKAAAFALVVIALWLIPTWTLTRGGDQVGSELQPRYLLPLIVILAGIALLPAHCRSLVVAPMQRAVVALALGGSFALALYVNLRRYVTGMDVSALDLGGGVEWWWAGLPSPMVLWALTTLAWLGMLVGLEILYRRSSKARESRDATAGVPTP